MDLIDTMEGELLDEKDGNDNRYFVLYRSYRGFLCI